MEIHRYVLIFDPPVAAHFFQHTCKIGGRYFRIWIRTIEKCTEMSTDVRGEQSHVECTFRACRVLLNARAGRAESC